MQPAEALWACQEKLPLLWVDTATSQDTKQTIHKGALLASHPLPPGSRAYLSLGRLLLRQAFTLCLEFIMYKLGRIATPGSKALAREGAVSQHTCSYMAPSCGQLCGSVSALLTGPASPATRREQRLQFSTSLSSPEEERLYLYSVFPLHSRNVLSASSPSLVLFMIRPNSPRNLACTHTCFNTEFIKNLVCLSECICSNRA